MKPQQLYYLEKHGCHDHNHCYVLAFWPEKDPLSKRYIAMKSEPHSVVWAVNKEIENYGRDFMKIGSFSFGQLRDEHMLIKDIFGDHK